MKGPFLAVISAVIAWQATAQNFEAGINGGLAAYSVHNVYNGAVYENATHYQSSVLSGVLSAGAMYDYKSFQLGVAVENTTIKYKSLNEPDLGGLILLPTIQYTVHQTPVKLIANRAVHFKKLTAYVGLSGLYNFTTNESKVVSPPSFGNVMNQTSRANSIGFGAQSGATYFVTKHIGFNAEVSGRYNNFPVGALDKNIFSFPVTVGVRCKL